MLKRNPFSPVLILFIAACACAQPPSSKQQTSQTPAQTSATKLGSIEINGLKRYQREQVIALSGLQIGQEIDRDAVEEAAERLSNSGLFKNLNYRYRSDGKQAVVTFEVVEQEASFPVVFDNFIWFSQEQIINAVRHDVPNFDGTAPESSGVIESIKRALEGLLQERKVPGRVEYTSFAEPSGANPKHIFSVKGVRLPICALHFPGARDVPERVLLESAQELFKGEYSQEFVIEFARVNLMPLYRQRGHLRASFLPPATMPVDGSDANCKEGVDLTLEVDEGAVYAWERAEWTGNAALTAPELDAALAMKANTIANGLKIDKAFDAVLANYGRKGYIMARLDTKPVFDDSNRRVIYQVNINEGAQFHMGALTINGLSDEDAARLKEKWKLQTGEVYDASYLDEFIKKVIGAAVGGKRVEGTQVKLDHQKMTVDVSISFK